MTMRNAIFAAAAIAMADRDITRNPKEASMKAKRAMVAYLVVLGMTGAAHAQTTSQTQKVPGQAGYEQSVKLTGEVVYTQGNYLVAKMRPSGDYVLFDVKPGREFLIDGQKKMIADLRPGTVLTAMILTKTTPVTVRTTQTLNGTVWWVSGNSVIVTLPNGENKQYKVADSQMFTVDGKQTTVRDLRAGMKVSATKVVEEPQTVITEETVITGTAPK